MSLSEALHYYNEEEGYVVIRGLIPVESCDRVRAGFDAVAPPLPHADPAPEEHAW